MSLSAVSHYMPPSGLLAQNAAQSYAQKPAAKEAGSAPRANFANELARTKIEQATLSGAPISLVNKSQLMSKRSVPVRSLSDVQQPSQPVQTAAATNTAESSQATKESDGYNFWDLVDLINPLQHLPIIGTIYRKVTGDEIKPEIQIAGSVLLGAATGSVVVSAISGVASALFEEHMGDDPLTMVADAVFGGEEETINPNAGGSEKIMIADAEQIDPRRLPASGAQQVASLHPDVQKIIDDAGAEQAQTAAATLLKEQEHMQKMSNPQSPEFVREFMMQALDKYKVAGSQPRSGSMQPQSVVR